MSMVSIDSLKTTPRTHHMMEGQPLRQSIEIYASVESQEHVARSPISNSHPRSPNSSARRRISRAYPRSIAAVQPIPPALQNPSQAYSSSLHTRTPSNPTSYTSNTNKSVSFPKSAPCPYHSPSPTFHEASTFTYHLQSPTMPTTAETPQLEHDHTLCTCMDNYQTHLLYLERQNEERLNARSDACNSTSNLPSSPYRPSTSTSTSSSSSRKRRSGLDYDLRIATAPHLEAKNRISKRTRRDSSLVEERELDIEIRLRLAQHHHQYPYAEPTQRSAGYPLVDTGLRSYAESAWHRRVGSEHETKSVGWNGVWSGSEMGPDWTGIISDGEQNDGDVEIYMSEEGNKALRDYEKQLKILERQNMRLQEIRWGS